MFDNSGLIKKTEPQLPTIWNQRFCQRLGTSPTLIILVVGTLLIILAYPLSR